MSIGNKIEPFKMWCQKVLPTVYDDSLSYYECLNKVTDYLNQVIDNINALLDSEEAFQASMSSQWSSYSENLTSQWVAYRDSLTAEWTTYKNYIDNYFNNLDVQTEINNKLDAMAQDGTLDALIAPYMESDIPTAVTTWLTAHVDPVGSAVTIDNTLTISGSAADSKTVGDRLSVLDVNVSDLDTFLSSKIDKASTKTNLTGTYEDSKLWNYSTGQYADAQSYYKTLYITSGFSSGDILNINGASPSNTSIYATGAFYDSSDNLVGLVFGSKRVVVPDNASALYINGNNAGTNYPSATLYTFEDTQIEDIINDIDIIEDELDTKQDKIKSYTEITGGTLTENMLWNYHTGTESSQNNYQYLLLSSGFETGKKYAFDGQQPSNQSAFASVVFYDSNMNILLRDNENTGSFVKIELIVPHNTAYIYINGRNSNPAKMYSISYSNLDGNTVENALSSNAFAIQNWMDRRYRDGEYEQFIRKTLDHLIVTFTIDDSHADISDIADAFITANVPLCLSTIPGYLNNLCNDNTTVLEVCTRVQQAGGEILGHNSFTIGATSNAQRYYDYFVTSKKTLNDNGLIVNGIVKSGGGTDDPVIKTCKTYLRSYYDYGCGFQYIDDNRYNIGRIVMTADISELKQRIDNNVNGGIINFYAHGSSDMGEGWVAKVMELVAYVQSKPTAEILTIGDMFTTYFTKSFNV